MKFLGPLGVRYEVWSDFWSPLSSSEGETERGRDGETERRREEERKRRREGETERRGMTND